MAIAGTRYKGVPIPASAQHMTDSVTASDHDQRGLGGSISRIDLYRIGLLPGIVTR